MFEKGQAFAFYEETEFLRKITRGSAFANKALPQIFFTASTNSGQLRAFKHSQQAAAANATAELLPKLKAAAAVYAEGETPDSPYAQLAQFTRAVAAYLAGSPPLPVPPSLAERYAGFIRRLAQQEVDTP